MIHPIPAGFIGALIYRMRGGPPSIPRPIEQMIFCSIYLYGLLTAGVNPWISAAAYGLSVAGCCTGHGQYFLGRYSEPVEKRERLDFIVTWLLGPDPRIGADHNELPDLMGAFGESELYWRNVTGMAVTGLAITLPIGIVAGSPLLALSGALKAPAYIVGRLISKTKDTELGEFLTGAALWSSAAALL